MDTEGKKERKGGETGGSKSLVLLNPSHNVAIIPFGKQSALIITY